MKTKIKFLLNLMLMCPVFLFATEYTIDSVDEFNDLNLSAGDVVIWEDGNYSSDERIKFLGNGTANNPITLKAETPGGVVFTGGLQMDIAGSYLIVDGFYWNGGYGSSNFIQFRDGDDYAYNSTIQNCAINGLGVSPDDQESGTSVKHRWVVLYGNYNSVLNCSFMNKSNAGATVLVELEYNAEENACTEVGHTISNNYFYKYNKIDTSLTNAGDSETIRVGTSEFQNVNCATIVSGNYFVEADGENEIITNKSANNVYVNNTFRRCRGSLVLRHGANATVERNVFLGENVEGTGGIRIVDSDHTISNNYIQDCVTVVDQAKWNNGITFMGGGDSSVTNCSSSSVSNGYQKSENITLSNNTIVNTDAPLFFNGDKGKNDNTGSVSNNVIYYSNGSNNITDVISGDDSDSFSSFGSTLSYSGNVYNNTSLGESTNGFTSSSLSSSNNGEILNISGASGKGADLDGYDPTTDSMVGNGIGACFIGAEGNNQTSCDTQTSTNSLTVSSLSDFNANGGTKTVTVTSNASWSISESTSWISTNKTSGSNNGNFTVTTTANTSSNSRSANVTVSVSGVTRTVTVSQEGEDEPTTPTSSIFTPDPNKVYHIDNFGHNVRLAATGNSEDAYTTSTNTTGDDVEWQFIAKGNGYWHLQRAAGGTKPRVRSDDSSLADMQASGTSGTKTYFEMAESTSNNSYYFTLPDRTNEYKRLQVDNSGDVKMVADTKTGTWVSFTITEVSSSNNPSESCSDGTNLALNGSIEDYSDQENTTNDAGNLIDDNTGNRWSASGFPQYAVIDLGDEYSVDEINLETFQDRDYQFTVQGSTSSNSGFSTLVNASNNSSSGPISSSFSAQTVRYVKLTITGANSYSGTWVSISEFEIFCSGNSSKAADLTNKDADIEIKGYPNPFSNSINISTTTNDPIEVKLIDVIGKTIIEKTINSNTTLNNLGKLNKGVYFLQTLNTKTQVVKVQKIIKN